MQQYIHYKVLLPRYRLQVSHFYYNRLWRAFPAPQLMFGGNLVAQYVSYVETSSLLFRGTDRVKMEEGGKH